MKIVYHNDEQKTIRVRINDSDFYEALNSGKDISRFYVNMEANEIKVFDLKVPLDTVPYIKKWQDVVMISYVNLATAELGPQQPPEDAA